MNWSLIILGLVALSSVAIAENSYLVIVPKLLKVGYDNQLSVFIAGVPQPVEVKFELTIGSKRFPCTTTVKPGETRNVTLTLPMDCPVGPGEMTIIGTGGVRFEEKHDIIVYDSRYVLLVQTSASTYRPGDMMEYRVVATNEEFIPLENEEVLIEIYDADLKLIGQFPRVPIRSGLTETFKFPISEHCNIGTWLVSATIGKVTSSVEVLVAEPVTPSFDLKAIFQRFLLRTDKTLRGVIEMYDDDHQPIFGRCLMAVGPITEQDVEIMMKERREQKSFTSSQVPMNEEWRKWKSQQMEISGRLEINYDLLSLFNVDVTKALAVQVYIHVTELASGQERVIKHIIPIFTRDVIYDIRPLEFEAGIKNEFEIIAKRPDGKPSKMEDLIVTVTMMMGNEQGKVQEEKSVEIKEFYTRGRNDIGFFNIEIPESCIGVLMTITPLSEDGKVRGYRTHAIPLMPTPRRDVKGAKLSIELLPSTMPLPTDVNTPVVSSQISTVGRMSNFYVQLLPWRPVEKFEPLPMSYVVLTNGRITLTGEFTIHPTKECSLKTKRIIKPEEQTPPECLFNGTLPIHITRAMMPYSTLLVYTFQPSFGFNVAESYRFSVAGLFPNTLTLNATIVPFTPTDKFDDSLESESMEHFDSFERFDYKPIPISERARGKTRVELSFTGTPDSTVGFNVIEYNAVTHGLSNEMTKERLLHYLTMYEQVPIVGMPTLTTPVEPFTHQKRGPGSEYVPEDEFSTTTKLPIEKEPPVVGVKREMEDIVTSTVHDMDVEIDHKTNPRPMFKPEKTMKTRAMLSEEDEAHDMYRERMGYKMRYPIEKMIFGINSYRGMKPMEGDDYYTTPYMGYLYGDEQSRRPSSYYRRRMMKPSGQYDVYVNDNDYVIATSFPLTMKPDSRSSRVPPVKVGQTTDDVEYNQQGEMPEFRGYAPQYGSSSWYEKMHGKLRSISQEAFTFMQSGLTIISDFPSLRIPVDMKRPNFARLLSKYHEHPTMLDVESFDVRDKARLLLEEYISEGDLSMMPPPVVFEEQARMGYYRSLYFNTTRIESQGVGKVVLPRIKPYSTWLATGFSLHPKSGLSFAQPMRLPTNTGLFVVCNFPDQVRMGEHVLLTCGINNYLGKDLTNVVVRLRASADFDLIEQTPNERMTSNNGKDYTMTIPSLKTWGVETRYLTLIPKRVGVCKILVEVECEFGGDYEMLTTYVRESGIERREVSSHLYDLTSEKKSYGPIVEKMTPSPFLRFVEFSVSGTGVDRLLHQWTSAMNSLVGIDRAIVRLWRLLGLRRYLAETKMESPLLEPTMKNLTMAYQKLQLYNDYNGSYSFISDQGEHLSSLYLTSMAFGTLISPYMPVRDNVTINRTLTWILSHQLEDGSFDDEGPCFHYRFCSGEYRRESLTALVLYTMTHHNVTEYLPEFVRRRLYDGERSPILRAVRYLESRLDTIKPDWLTNTFVEFSLVQCRLTPETLKQKIFQDVRSRQLTVVPEDGSRYLKYTNEKMTRDDELLLNALTLSIYAYFGDFKTTLDMARWMVDELETYQHYDTALYAIFHTEAWIKTECLFRQRFAVDKFSIMVDVTADNGQKHQFKIDPYSMDMTQKFYFTLPVNQITYTVNGFGLCSVCIKQMYWEKQQPPTPEPLPFQLTNEFVPMPWFSDINARTCLTYTPTPRDLQYVKDTTFNRTVVVEVQIPSGMRLNLRQIGFMLSRVPEAMWFTMSERENKINFFLNIPSTVYGKPICLEWYLERLSFVKSWAPIYIRCYDYLQPRWQLVRLMPVQFQPSVLGYSFVDAVIKARPSLEQLNKMQP